MRSLRAQLILSHVLPFVLIFPLVGLVLLYLLGAQLWLNQLSDELGDRAALIAGLLAARPELLGDEAEAQRFLQELGSRLDEQIYLLDSQGRVIAAGPNAQVTPGETLGEGTLVTEEVIVTIQTDLAGPEGQALAPVVGVNEQILGVVGVRQSLRSVAGSVGRVRNLVIVTILGGMALGALVGLLLARRLEQPISRAATAVGDIAAGRPVAHLPPAGPEEIRALSESVNVLSERLRILEQTRRRSLANIVHELGRPLGAVHAAVQVLREAPGEDPAIRAELLDGMEQELSHMEPVLDDLAQLHSQVVGQPALERRPTPLGEWLAGALLPWRAAALQKGLEWSAELPPDLPEVDIDPDRMTQVVGNLLSNAVKYTPPGGRVWVTAEADEATARILVADNGPGIAVEEQERVFEPFYRSRRPQRFSEGLGLGLAIARGLVEAHGGRLWLKSEEGEGCLFGIELPVEKSLSSDSVY